MEFNKLSNIKTTPGQMEPAKMGSQAALPQAVSMIKGLYQAYGIDFGEINMADPKFKDKVVAAGKVAEIAKVNIGALQQMLNHTATLMAGQIALAEFYAKATQVTVAGKKRIDKATAAAFLSLSDYGKHTAALATGVERKLKAQDAKYELIGQLGEGKLQTSLKLIEMQRQSGEKTVADSVENIQARRDMLNSVGARRRQDREYIRYGHLNTAN